MMLVLPPVGLNTEVFYARRGLPNARKRIDQEMEDRFYDAQLTIYISTQTSMFL